MTTMNNSIMTIRPYKRGSIWAFDEPELGILAEPFCGQINDMIDEMLERADLPASEQFTGMFSGEWFPDWHMMMSLDKEEGGGNWYYDVSEVPVEEGVESLRGWLCPAMFKFWCSAPRQIFVRAEP